MMLHIEQVLTKQQVAQCRQVIDAAEWIDGNVTAGQQSALAKRNMQLPEGSPAARQTGEIILDALERCPRFVSAALPLKVFPPLFNKYVFQRRVMLALKKDIAKRPHGRVVKKLKYYCDVLLREQ